MKNTTATVFKVFYIVIAAVVTATMLFAGYFNISLPKNYYVLQGEELVINTAVPINAVKTAESGKNNYGVTLKVLGIIPVSNANVNVVDKMKVKVLGTPFGIKIYTDGVMVVGINNVDVVGGESSPAKDAGLKLGDLITSINGQTVLTNEEVAAIIEKSDGENITLNITRSGSKKVISLKPVLSKSTQSYKAGIWVRDSSAGIGTQTFYSPTLGVISGLGHGISDQDTGKILTVNNGEIVSAEILAVQKSEKGSPGELKGKFLDETLGSIAVNNTTGLYAVTDNYSYNKEDLTEIALKQEIKTGPAKILTTIDGTQPKYYDCNIEKISYNGSLSKNMLVRITDKSLISATGGIVQGMSGSPVIQNGKLIGAITHVLVDDPTAGYAIFAENMLNTAQSINSNNDLKKVS